MSKSKKHKTFEEYVNRLRELSGIKGDEDVFKELEQNKPESLSEEEINKLKESSLSRIGQHINEHDIATITAFREQSINCIDKSKNTGYEFTKKENLERNKILRASLLRLKYGVTLVDGISKEGKKIVNEDSFLVVNLNDEKNFIENMIKLGKHYCQDSILLKRKDEENAYLHGTNTTPDPNLDETLDLGKYKPGIENEFMSSIRGRPFHFESYDKLQINSKRIITEISKEVLNEILNKNE